MNFPMNLHNFSFFFLESFNIFYLKKGEKCHKGSINSCNTWWLLYQNQERKRCLFTVQTLISFHVNLLLIKYNLCGMKCWCSHTVIETNWVLFIKIHNFIRKILLPLKCKSLPPPTLKSFCTGVTGTTAAGSTDEWVLLGCTLKSPPTKMTPGTPKPRRSRNGTAPERC